MTIIRVIDEEGLPALPLECGVCGMGHDADEHIEPGSAILRLCAGARCPRCGGGFFGKCLIVLCRFGVRRIYEEDL